MKWYSYLWIGVRFLLFWFLYHIAISIITGLIIGFINVESNKVALANDSYQFFNEVMQDVVWIGIISLVVSGLISGFQHFKYYQRRVRELTEYGS